MADRLGRGVRALAAVGGLVFSLTTPAAPTVELNGEWRLDCFPQPDAGAVRTLAEVPAGAQSVTATVPGNCELDLVRAGVLPVPEVGLNVLKFHAWENRQWLYTKDFEAPAVEPGGKAVLVFEGIDTLSDIFLNGEKLGETANMLIPHEFEVTKRLRPGTNRLQVLLRSVALEAQDRSVDVLGYSVGNVFLADLQLFRKAAHMGGWDIFPRLMASGLWRRVRLECRAPEWIDEVNWIVSDIDPKDATGASVEVRCRVRAPFARRGRSQLRARLVKDGQVAAERTVTYRGAHPQIRLGHDDEAKQKWNWVPGLERWWPRGMGAQPLYDAEVALIGEDGAVLARHGCRLGIRMVALERDDIYGPDRPGQFLFKVNGTPVYIRGSNWVPLDALHGRDEARLLETLEMFKDLNCNMIRVWGGGVYEPDAFFDWCDENGMLVWQDFMTGCSVFPQDDDYAQATREEAVAVVKRLRNHASLALWSGNNENDQAFHWSKPGEFAQDPNRDRNSRVTLSQAVFEYDMTRPYLPSSPFISPEVYALKAKPSEDHLWGERAYYKVGYYTNSPCWFASEMGYHGCPNRESLEKMMTKGSVYPWTKVTGTDPWKDYHWNDEWLLKASNPFLDKSHVSYVRRNSLMTNQTKIMFGSVPTELDDFIFASQIVQAEAMKTFVELFRSQKFTKKNGLIWWNVRDGWPQISDAVVDYYGGKKRAYYAIRNVQQDQLVMVRDDHQVVAVNDTLKEVRGKVRITDRESGQVVFEREYSVAANAAVELGEVAWSGQGVLDIAYEQGAQQSSNWFLYGEPPFAFGQVKTWFAR